MLAGPLRHGHVADRLPSAMGNGRQGKGRALRRVHDGGCSRDGLAFATSGRGGEGLEQRAVVVRGKSAHADAVASPFGLLGIHADGSRLAVGTHRRSEKTRRPGPRGAREKAPAGRIRRMGGPLPASRSASR